MNTNHMEDNMMFKSKLFLTNPAAERFVSSMNTYVSREIRLLNTLLSTKMTLKL